MNFIGTIEAYRSDMCCEPECFALVIPIFHRLEDKESGTIDKALDQIQLAGAAVFKDVTLDGFVKTLEEDDFNVVALVTHTDGETGLLEFRDGFWDPAQVAERLSRIRKRRVLDLTTCWSDQLIGEIKRQRVAAIDVVGVTDRALKPIPFMLYYEALVRLLCKAGAERPYRELVLALWKRLPDALKEKIW